MGLQEARYGAMRLEKLISNRRGRRPGGPLDARTSSGLAGCPACSPYRIATGHRIPAVPFFTLHSALFPFSCNQKEYSAPTMIRRPGMG